MKFTILFASLMILYTAPTWAANESAPVAYATSVFFTPDELAKIASPGKNSSITPPDIHLGAVFYYGPDSWSVWLNGARWTPATKREDLQIIEVRQQQVRLLVRQDDPLAGSPQTIVLKPHQTWQAATGKVIEGML